MKQKKKKICRNRKSNSISRLQKKKRKLKLKLHIKVMIVLIDWLISYWNIFLDLNIVYKQISCIASYSCSLSLSNCFWFINYDHINRTHNKTFEWGNIITLCCDLSDNVSRIVHSSYVDYTCVYTCIYIYVVHTIHW